MPHIVRETVCGGVPTMQSCQMHFMPFLHSASVWQICAEALVEELAGVHVFPLSHCDPAVGARGLVLSPTPQQIWPVLQSVCSTQ